MYRFWVNGMKGLHYNKIIVNGILNILGGNIYRSDAGFYNISMCTRFTDRSAIIHLRPGLMVFSVFT